MTTPFKFPWGGLIETLLELEDQKILFATRNDLESYKNSLLTIESTKKFSELKKELNQFTEKQLNYLHSPLLDEFYKSCAEAENVEKACENACGNGHLRVFERLLQLLTHKEEREYFYFYKCLLPACRNGHLNIVQFLTEKGEDIYADDNLLFRTACANSHLHIAKYLFAEGDLCIQDEENEAMRTALMKNNIEIVRFLLDSGVDPNDDYDQLMYAINNVCEDNRVELMRLLIEKGYKIQNANIALAVECANYEMVELLLAHGASLRVAEKGVFRWFSKIIDDSDDLEELLALATDEELSNIKRIAKLIVDTKNARNR